MCGECAKLSQASRLGHVVNLITRHFVSTQKLEYDTVETIASLVGRMTLDDLGLGSEAVSSESSSASEASDAPASSTTTKMNTGDDDDADDSDDSKSAIRYTCLASTPHFEIGVFHLRKGATIPLHDHPHMCVISSVLYGSVHVQSYDWVAQPMVQRRILDSSSSSSCSSSNNNTTRPSSSSTTSRNSSSSSCCNDDGMTDFSSSISTTSSSSSASSSSQTKTTTSSSSNTNGYGMLVGSNKQHLSQPTGTTSSGSSNSIQQAQQQLHHRDSSTSGNSTSTTSTTTTSSSSSDVQDYLHGAAELTSNMVWTNKHGARVLYPRSGGNIHQFVATTDVAIFDIMLPPYDNANDRPCHFYEVVAANQVGPAYLREIPEPSWFVVDNHRFDPPLDFVRRFKHAIQLQRQRMAELQLEQQQSND